MRWFREGVIRWTGGDGGDEGEDDGGEKEEPAGSKEDGKETRNLSPDA